MYQRLGNLYANQRIGSFESDGNGFGRHHGGKGHGRGHRHGDHVPTKNLTTEQLSDKLAKKEAKLTQMQQKIASGTAGPNAARHAARLEKHVAQLRAELASRKGADVLNGLGALDIGSFTSPVGLGIGALLGAAGVYWFVIRR